jgi:hypothetical protein
MTTLGLPIGVAAVIQPARPPSRPAQKPIRPDFHQIPGPNLSLFAAFTRDIYELINPATLRSGDSASSCCFGQPSSLRAIMFEITQMHYDW